MITGSFERVSVDFSPKKGETKWVSRSIIRFFSKYGKKNTLLRGNSTEIVANGLTRLQSLIHLEIKRSLLNNGMKNPTSSLTLLLRLGVKPQDTVMGDIFNTYEWFILLMGCAKARLIFSSQNFMLPEGQVCKLMDDSQVAVFVYDASLKDMALKAIELVNVKPKLAIMCGPGDPPTGHISFDKFIEGKSKEAPPTEKDVVWLDPVLGLYTSGTTGLPKGFTLNHGIIFFDNMMNTGLHKIDELCVSLATNPLFHRGGNTTGVLPALHCGGSVVIMKSFDENLALDYIEKYKVTHMVSAPVIYERMIQAQIAKPRRT